MILIATKNKPKKRNHTRNNKLRRVGHHLNNNKTSEQLLHFGLKNTKGNRTKKKTVIFKRGSFFFSGVFFCFCSEVFGLLRGCVSSLFFVCACVERKGGGGNLLLLVKFFQSILMALNRKRTKMREEEKPMEPSINAMR